MRRRAITAALLLASILSVTELAKTGPYFGLSPLTQRILRTNRIGEPSAKQTGDIELVAQPTADMLRPDSATEAPAYLCVELSRPFLIVSRSPNQFRSPPLFT